MRDYQLPPLGQITKHYQALGYSYSGAATRAVRLINIIYQMDREEKAFIRRERWLEAFGYKKPLESVLHKQTSENPEQEDISE